MAGCQLWFGKRQDHTSLDDLFGILQPFQRFPQAGFNHPASKLAKGGGPGQARWDGPLHA